MFRSVAITLTLCMVSMTAQPALVRIDTTVDLTEARFFYNTETPVGVVHTYLLPSSVMIGVGDTVDMTVRFADGQRLSLLSSGGDQFLSGWLLHDSVQSPPHGTSNFTITDATLTFLDATGGAVMELAKPRETNGNGHLGPLFEGAYIPRGESLTFSAYRTTFTVEALRDNAKYYSGPFVLTSIQN